MSIALRDDPPQGSSGIPKDASQRPNHVRQQELRRNIVLAGHTFGALGIRAARSEFLGREQKRGARH
ncbi:hypothetical protein [Bradyrhizobium genosp. P]|uniref:hypothetical protein n=1 Tax=Bradyrhizobium genosp. P TaxID=83641 RepID=UPI003CF9180B